MKQTRYLMMIALIILNHENILQGTNAFFYQPYTGGAPRGMPVPQKDDLKQLKSENMALQREVNELKKKQNELDKKVSVMEGNSAHPESPVSFTASMSADTKHTFVGATLYFDEVSTNVGKAYNPKSSIFTCSKDGVYVFSVTILVKGDGHLLAQIVKNGMPEESVEAKGGSASAMTTLELKSGDRVWIKVFRSKAAILPGGTYNSFSGWMI